MNFRYYIAEPLEVIGANPLPGNSFWERLLGVFFGPDGIFSNISVDAVISFVTTLWDVFVIISYLLSFIFLCIYVFATVQKSKLEEIEEEQIKAKEEAYARERSGGATPNRFAELQEHISSENPNDWKLAIIEADIILDEALKRQGYAGTSLGERLKSISPESLHSIRDAWDAHMVRNKIAHGTEDFVLTHKIARETIVQYEHVFQELGIM
jgi:hypothetical protein